MRNLASAGCWPAWSGPQASRALPMLSCSWPAWLRSGVAASATAGIGWVAIWDRGVSVAVEGGCMRLRFAGCWSAEGVVRPSDLGGVPGLCGAPDWPWHKACLQSRLSWLKSCIHPLGFSQWHRRGEVLVHSSH